MAIFYFVNADIHEVLEKAKIDAGNKDVRISGGANVIQQYLNAGLVDELNIHITPIMLGRGVRLFDNIDDGKITLEIINVIHSPMVTHLFYKVINKNSNQQS